MKRFVDRFRCYGTLPLSFLLTLTSWLIPAAAIAQTGTKVILSPNTFTSTQLQALQPLADQVALIVDVLVPGTP